MEAELNTVWELRDEGEDVSKNFLQELSPKKIRVANIRKIFFICFIFNTLCN